MKLLLHLLTDLLPTRIVSAHCDVPCGIYDPKGAQTAAATVARMVHLIKEIPDEPTLENRNKFVRCVMTKEEHAQKCKDEILILWTDYFKPEHLEKFPDLHDTFWKTAKLCSKAKQTVDEQVAKDLIEAVDHIADIFNQSKEEHTH